MYMQAKNIVIALVVLALVGAGVYLFITSSSQTTVTVDKSADGTMPDVLPVEPDGGIGDGALPLPEELSPTRSETTSLGQSVSGKELMAYHFGTGAQEILLIGGVHGGYSPNTSRLAEEFIAYFKANPSVIPSNVMVTVIPNLNPDGALKTGATGRFNANEVDLNRNFDCEWSETGTWQSREVSGGDVPFSEPEAAALRDYVEQYDPTAAVVWFSAEGKVYPSACGTTPNRTSVTLAATFATAAGYPAEAEFNAYAITGDMVNWMAKQGIPAISVLLSDHQGTEWSKNEAGIKAVLSAYAQ